MKLQPLYDLLGEINRLFVAGSKFSVEDPRLQKQIPVFKKLGEKAPVFAKIASDLEALSTCRQEESAEKLLAVSTLLYSVLYTQGESIETDKTITEQEPTFELKDIKTNISYQEIKPVIDALSTTGSGRLEIVQDAFERGLLNDSRLYHYLSYALGDKYGEMISFLEEKAIPAIGKPIIPTLLKDFKVENNKVQERRFRLLRTLGYDKLDEFTDHILSSSCTDLQVETIHYLSNDPKNEELLIGMLSEKGLSKLKAVYEALAKIGTEKSLSELVGVYLKNKTKNKLVIFAGALSKTSLPFFFQEVFEKALNGYNEAKQVDYNPKVQKQSEYQAIVDLHLYIDTLRQSIRPEALDFFLEIIGDNNLHTIVEKITKQSYELNDLETQIVDSIINCVRYYEIQDQIDFYKKALAKLKDSEWKTALLIDYFRAYCNSGVSKENIFDTFEEYFKKGKLRIEILPNNFFKEKQSYYDITTNTIKKELLDPRWIDLIYKLLKEGKHSNLNYILHFLDCYESRSKRFEELLVHILQNFNLREIGQVTLYMAEIGSVQNFDMIMDKIEKESVKEKMRYLYNYALWETIRKFPKEYAEKFELLDKKHKKTCGDLFKTIATQIEQNN